MTTEHKSTLRALALETLACFIFGVLAFIVAVMFLA